MMNDFKPEGPAGDGYAEVVVSTRRRPDATVANQPATPAVAVISRRGSVRYSRESRLAPISGASQFGSGGGCLPTAVGRISSALPIPRPLTSGDYGDRARE